MKWVQLAVEPNVSVEGFCTGMCPDYQLRSRTQHANENSLEVVDPLGKGRSIDQLATKKFERNVSNSRSVCLSASHAPTAVW